MERHSNKIRNQRGFTLLEMLFALSILAIALALMLSALRLGASSWERGERAVEMASLKRSVVERLRMEAGSMYPYMDDEKGELLFSGKPGHIAFITSCCGPSGGPWGGLRAVYYSSEGGGVRVGQAVVPSASMFDVRGGSSSLDGLSGIKFEYLGDEGWAEEWDAEAQKALPKAVRAVFHFANGSTPVHATVLIGAGQDARG